MKQSENVEMSWGTFTILEGLLKTQYEQKNVAMACDICDSLRKWAVRVKEERKAERNENVLEHTGNAQGI